MTSPISSVYTASTVFLRSLSEAGITHAFVNWGSDHPALLEELGRQRSSSQNISQRPKNNEDDLLDSTIAEITTVTSPHEMVALSAAQGFAQVTGKPAAVIIHVDVGTQALAGAVHNVDRSRTPVLIYAGASPFSTECEYKGTRNEWIMWLQDVPDQGAIVRQYMRHTSQIGSSKTIDKSIKRALQIAISDPKGPVYLWARREIMEQVVQEDELASIGGMKRWPKLEKAGLSPSAQKQIATALLTAVSPLIITSHIGRTSSSIAHLLSLASLLSVPILSACPSTVNVPFSHYTFAGVTFLVPGTHWTRLNEADVILVLDCDLPWIPANATPREDARVFVVDGGDPLKLGIGYWHVDAEMVCRADAGVALMQIEVLLRQMGLEEGSWNHHVHREDGDIDLKKVEIAVGERRQQLKTDHRALLKRLEDTENEYPSSSITSTSTSSFTVPNLMSILQQSISNLTPSKGANVLVLNESISNFPATWMHLRPEYPGSMISSGGSSIGWALGAAVGASLGAIKLGTASTGQKGYELVVAVVGDGSFMFGVPSSAYWMARKYQTPFLTIILNNGGWKSPKLSMMSVHPAGHGQGATGDQLSVGFGPHAPDYSQIAVAASAGWAWGTRIGGPGWGNEQVKEELTKVIHNSIRVVMEEGRCAVVDCVLDSI